MFSMKQFFRRAKLLVPLALLFIIHGCDCISAMQSTNPLEELVFPGGFDVDIHKQEEYHTCTISYSVELPYPSKKVIEFYEHILEKDGWSPYIEAHREYANRVWQSFIDQTIKGSPLVHQLFTQWKKKNEIAFLSIRYYSYGSKQDNASIPSNNVQNVALQFAPSIDSVPPGVGFSLPPVKEK